MEINAIFMYIWHSKYIFSQQHQNFMCILYGWCDIVQILNMPRSARTELSKSIKYPDNK